jgi:hypothetical protein
MMYDLVQGPTMYQGTTFFPPSQATSAYRSLRSTGGQLLQNDEPNDDESKFILFTFLDRINSIASFYDMKFESIVSHMHLPDQDVGRGFSARVGERSLQVDGCLESGGRIDTGEGTDNFRGRRVRFDLADSQSEHCGDPSLSKRARSEEKIEGEGAMEALLDRAIEGASRRNRRGGVCQLSILTN